MPIENAAVPRRDRRKVRQGPILPAATFGRNQSGRGSSLTGLKITTKVPSSLTDLAVKERFGRDLLA